MSPSPVCIAIVGPTGTGKSDLAAAVAEEIGGEVVGCDALQVYRGFDVGTAKPPETLRRRVPHHLVDVADPREDFNLARYVAEARAVCREIRRRGRVPVIAGGTGLYLRGLLRGVIPAPPRDPETRRRLLHMVERFGAPRLHRWLARVDPKAAAKLAPKDRQRIVRALEIRLLGGTAWSELLEREGTWRDPGDGLPALRFGLDLDRDVLKARLAERVRSFFDAGLVLEVRRLLDLGVPVSANAFKAIGYREVLRAILEDRDPEHVVEEVIRNTWRYAKRQRTWFRGEPGIQWLDAGRPVEENARRIVGAWEKAIRR